MPPNASPRGAAAGLRSAAQLDDRALRRVALLDHGDDGLDAAAATGCPCLALRRLEAERLARHRRELDVELAALAGGDDERALAVAPAPRHDRLGVALGLALRLALGVALGLAARGGVQVDHAL